MVSPDVSQVTVDKESVASSVIKVHIKITILRAAQLAA